jgi:hypothetical protein
MLGCEKEVVCEEGEVCLRMRGCPSALESVARWRQANSWYCQLTIGNDCIGTHRIKPATNVSQAITDI